MRRSPLQGAHEHAPLRGSQDYAPGFAGGHLTAMEQLIRDGLMLAVHCVALAARIYAWMYQEPIFTMEHRYRYGNAMREMRRNGGSSSDLANHYPDG